MASLLRGTAYITGAGSGIGRAVAYSMARHGVRSLALTDLRPRALDETIAGLRAIAPDVDAHAMTVDAAVEGQVDASVAETVARFGSIDYAVNNAGRGGPGKASPDLSIDDWKALLDVNLTGVWLGMRTQIRAMSKQEKRNERHGRGTIVNVASMLGTRASLPTAMSTDYTASKHGVMGLTKADAVAYAASAIRINAVCPGYVETPLLTEVAKTGALRGEVEKVPMRRLATPEEIGDAVVFLSSEMASFVCGHGLLVDGGYTA